MGFADEKFSDLLDRVQAKSATPGGGTAAALAGSLGAALGRMAIAFTLGRKSTGEELAAVLRSVDRSLAELDSRLRALADEDTSAYEAVRQARRLPRESESERAARGQAIQEAVASAAEVPMRTARLCRDGLEMLEGIKERLNPNLSTDAGSAAMLLRSGSASACLNVEVNLLDLEDPARVEAYRAELARLRARVEYLEGRVLEWVAEQIRPAAEN